MILKGCLSSSSDTNPSLPPSPQRGEGRVRGKLIGVGIDLVSWDRIKSLLDRHPADSLKRLLTPSERKIFKNSSDPVRSFGRFFAAKEAYFKASGASAMGEKGFRGIEVLIDGDREFSAVSPLFDPEGQYEIGGEFFETPEGIGAGVLLWKSCREEV